MQDEGRIRIIRERDKLLDFNGVIPLKYFVKKTLGIGNDSIRELELDLGQQKILFPNSKGAKINLPITDIVSISPTDNQGLQHFLLCC